MRSGIVAALLVCGTSVAHAQTFEEAAEGAVRLDRRALEGLFFSLTADCSHDGRDDMLRRQCEVVRAARAERVTTQTFSIALDRGVFSVGDWDAAQSALPFVLRGCVACAAPLTGGRYVVTKGSVTVENGVVKAPELHRASRRFGADAAASRWKTAVAPRLRAELLFRVPAKPEAWSQGGLSGWFVEPIAYRVYDPCDGVIVCSDPTAAGGEVDAATCDPEKIEGHAIDPDAGKAGPPVPYQLGADDVRRIMRAALGPVNGCFDAYNVPGTADLYVEIVRDGTVKSVEVLGLFADTPTGECVASAVRRLRFPPFKRDHMKIHFPFILK